MYSICVLTCSVLARPVLSCLKMPFPVLHFISLPYPPLACSVLSCLITPCSVPTCLCPFPARTWPICPALSCSLACTVLSSLVPTHPFLLYPMLSCPVLTCPILSLSSHFLYCPAPSCDFNIMTLHCFCHIASVHTSTCLSALVCPVIS
jgi:hypothetical protein